MCFSATASFGAGIFLAAVGVSTLKKVRDPSAIYFASIPLIFSFQQLSEGFLWLSLSYPNYASLEAISTYTFLFFAHILWPLWIPFALFKLEKNQKSKKHLQFSLGMGVIVSFYLAYCLIVYEVDAKIIGYHISYILKYPISINNYEDLLYSIATIAPCFISTIKRMWILGVVITVSYAITQLFYADYVISVWCFFAAIISAIVTLIMPKLQDKVIQTRKSKE